MVPLESGLSSHDDVESAGRFDFRGTRPRSGGAAGLPSGRNHPPAYPTDSPLPPIFRVRAPCGPAGDTAAMTTTNERSVELRRIGERRFEVTNARGGRLVLAEGADPDFTPVELLLAAVAGCSAVDVDYLTTRRAEPDAFAVVASAEKLNDEHGNHLGPVTARFAIDFPHGPDGDRAREVLPAAVARSRDRLCTVSRTVQLPTEVSFEIAPGKTDPGKTDPGKGEGPGEYESPGPSDASA